jgi:hypothetical protein
MHVSNVYIIIWSSKVSSQMDTPRSKDIHWRFAYKIISHLTNKVELLDKNCPGGKFAKESTPEIIEALEESKSQI